jgi:hypothetical protein
MDCPIRVAGLPDRSQRIAKRTPAAPPSREQHEAWGERPAEAADKSEQDEHTPRRIVAKAPENGKFLHDAFLSETAVQQAIQRDAN